MSTFGNYPEVQCPICHKVVTQNFTVLTYFEDKFLTICPQCYGYIGKCQTCEYGAKCSFEADNSLPHIVLDTIRQGPAVIQRQIKNPVLVEKHCINCRCAWDDKGTCCAGDTNIDCSNYVINSKFF
jgi:hypothetical protein